MIIKTTVKIKEIDKWLSPHRWGASENENRLISSGFNIIIDKLYFYKIRLSDLTPNADIINFIDEMIFVELLEIRL